MTTTDTIIIGAGHAGLAMSRCLAERGVDHVVLERGRLAERWRSERWDSLRLLTPNWMTRLPGWSYDGSDPDGFMRARDVVSYFERYAHSFAAPVVEETVVEAVRREGGGYRVDTASGTWRASNVVIATGWCDRPAVPAMARDLASDVHQVDPTTYRKPSALPAGGVLVVGASATGVQLAAELHAAGRDVALAVGRHTRMPRQYRGMDIFWWLERTGHLDKTIDQTGDPDRARFEPSLQLAGRTDGQRVDLAALQAAGVRLTGRLTGIDGHRVSFAADLPTTTAVAHRRLRRVLEAIDRHIDDCGLSCEVLAPERVRAVAPLAAPVRGDLRDAGITTVVWATGFRRVYPWLHLPVLDAAGEIRHRRGVTPIPGLHVLGQRFQHTRRSSFIDGVGADAEFLADHLTRTRSATPS